MPGQRAPGQRLIPIPMSEEFIAEIDAALEDAGYSDRSKFIRDAIYEKLERMGKDVPRGVSLAPTRTGKVPASSSGAIAIVEDDAAVYATAAERALKSQRSPKAASPTGKKYGPSRGVSRGTKARPVVPKPVPTGHES